MMRTTDDLRGLSEAEASARLRRDGPNALPQADRRRWPRILLDLLREPMLLLLIAASLLYVALGDAKDAALLGVSVLLVIGLTLYQELRSEHALQALRDLSSPRARVLRDGVTRVIPAREVVVGDVLLIAEGDRVPADARLLASDELHVDESLLTGESVSVRRDATADDDQARIFAGTLVVRGQARAETMAVGVATEMGRIGTRLRQQTSPRTPLQREMRHIVMWLAAIAFVSCALVVGIHLAMRGDLLQALLAGITLAMANIPEEFPVVLTVFLALGGWRMARQRVLVRRPAAIEALGAVTVLCTDKTGTLTENRMAVAEVRAGENDALSPQDAKTPGELALLRCAALASEAHAHEPMDRAIVEAATHAAISEFAMPLASSCLRTYPLARDLLAYIKVWRVASVDDTADASTTLFIACKGAPETVAALCRLPASVHANALQASVAMAQRGLRVIAVAEASWPDDANAMPLPDDPRAFAFRWHGLVGLADPLRASARGAVADARAAGVRVMMLTGDHPETARAIAADAGLSERPDVVLGSQLDALDADAIAAIAHSNDVFARVRPEHKLALIGALQASGEIVAMTGDGVNDAPALLAAHVGIAMGGRGTDVAREASSIVLLDDDFASIVRAIAMGRTIYDNIRRATRYIIAVHVPITGLALLPLLFGTPLILLPLHVVFLEMIIDPASSIALEREPPADDLMRRPPRATQARLIDRRRFLGSVVRGVLVFVAVLAIYLYARWTALPASQQAALAFIALVIGNLGLIVAHRNGETLRQAIFRPNPAFLAVIVPTLALLAAITQWQTPGRWFGFSPPPLFGTLAAATLPLLLVWSLEAWLRMRVSTRSRRTVVRAD